MINPIDIRVLKRLLRESNITPRKHWGQNFLVSKKILVEMLDVAHIKKDDTILEIGGGVGTLSIELAKIAKRLIVIERDPSLCEILKNTLKPFDNVEILCKDARKIDTKKLFPNNYSVVANLPYSVGLPILMNLLEDQNPPISLHVMLQREVAERLCAGPPKGNIPGMALQYLATVEKLFQIPANATWPAPDVDSAYIRIIPREGIAPWDSRLFMKALRRGFMHPRKKVINNLSSDEHQRAALMGVCQIDENARAQQLTLEQWRCIATHLPTM